MDESDVSGWDVHESGIKGASVVCTAGVHCIGLLDHSSTSDLPDSCLFWSSEFKGLVLEVCRIMKPLCKRTLCPATATVQHRLKAVLKYKMRTCLSLQPPSCIGTKETCNGDEADEL
ncbi:hypothetical protein NDU88_010270 [Pleurodeles waltl]|uniref:Uncharacterized protein n=1 Tax=Pleurodeles waltl TaxID=8319 RepID=A0AAV7PV66_PLEWA|nr:hypothetical protein NDU88_010270 [Pleurodeles waltl]